MLDPTIHGAGTSPEGCAAICETEFEQLSFQIELSNLDPNLFQTLS
jgi:hypothetical protein